MLRTIISIALLAVSMVHPVVAGNDLKTLLDIQKSRPQLDWAPRLPGSNSEAWMKSLAAGKNSPKEIANEEMQKRRSQVLNLLGIPEQSGSLYIFVSLSMPEKMLRAYMREAIWSGAELVLRGITPGMTLQQFALSKMAKLAGGKGAAATIRIDPRLFDVYGVTVVPTLVLSGRSEFDLCNEGRTESIGVGNHGKLQIARCKEADKEEYWKISGSVTLGYALEEFESAGASDAEPYLLALRKAPFDYGRDQTPYNGDWEDLPLPQGMAEVMDALIQQKKELESQPKQNR